MTLAEALETTRIPRVAGLTGRHTAFVTTRPFHAPHHTGVSADLLHGCGRIWTRPRWQDSGELLRDRDRCMRISGFLLEARLAFEP